MPSGLGKSRESGREYEGKYEDYGNSVRARCNGALNGEFVQEPDRNHKERQDHGGNHHRYTGGYAIAVVVVNTIIVVLLSTLLWTFCC